jgi:hypothetical protein
MTLDQVRKMLIQRAKKYQVYRGTSGVCAWCSAHGVAKARASEFLSGKRLPTTDILDALGLEWRVMRK